MVICHSKVQYEHIVISGLPAERGRQYGEKAAKKIRRNIAHYLEPGQLPPWEDVTRYIHSLYIPALQMYFPSALEELEGIATGAGVSLEEIIMVNARYDLARTPGGSRYRPQVGNSGSGSREEVPAPVARYPTSLKSSRNKLPAHPAAQYQRERSSTPQSYTSLHASDYDDFNECTSAGFLSPTTSDGSVICAQNWDISSYLYKDDLVILLEIHPDPSEGKPSMFVVTEAGQMGRSGMNSAGLGLCANALSSSNDFAPSIDEPNPKPYLPIALLRRLYLESKSFPQAMQAISNAPRHVSGNLTLATAEGFALCMELTPREVFILTPDGNQKYIVHSNHYLHPAMKARPDVHDRYPGGSSWYRNIRFQEGIKDRLEGQVDVRTLQRAFSDHLGYPQALCQHVDTSPGSGLPGYPFKGSMTVACIIYNLTRKTVTTCKGNPCTGVFETYRLDE